MPLYLTAAHSSRIQKSSSVPGLRRHSSSPFSSHARIKTGQRSKSVAKAWEDESSGGDGGDGGEDRLGPTGKTLSIVAVAAAKDVLTAIQHGTKSMFCEIPDRAGMNSTRIAEVLNFQKNLPRVLSLAHVHALISASSKTERQIVALMAEGSIRKIKVNGRGNDISGTAEVLIAVDELRILLRRSAVAQDVITDFLNLLRQEPREMSVSSRLLPVSHVSTLTQAGFLVSSSLSGTRNLSLSGASLVSMPTISRAASGSSAAVGGDAAFENLGGVGGPRRSSQSFQTPSQNGDLFLSVPNLGPYLRLLNAGRNHLMELLGKSTYKEAPLYLLRERWDGAVDSDSRVSSAKRVRGEFSAIMPTKTRKWKDLYGLDFDWTLAECLGAGMIELFETRSVGLGIRSLM